MTPVVSDSIESERIADGERRLADLQVGRRSDRDRFGEPLRIVQLNDGKVVIGSGAEDIGCHGLVSRQPHSDRIRSGDHVVVGDDVAGFVPDDAGAGLNADDFIALGIDLLSATGAAHHLYDRWRGIIENLDRRALHFGKAAARLDWARRRCRKEVIVDIGAKEQCREQDQHSRQQHALESVFHGFLTELELMTAQRAGAALPE